MMQLWVTSSFINSRLIYELDSNWESDFLQRKAYYLQI